MGQTGCERAELGHAFGLAKLRFRLSEPVEQHAEERPRRRGAAVQQRIHLRFGDRDQPGRLVARPHRRHPGSRVEQRDLTDDVTRMPSGEQHLPIA